MSAQKADGMNYAPQGLARPVCRPGEFRFAAMGLDHGHIYGQCNGLREAGGELVWVFDPDPAKVAQFSRTYPGVKVARNEQEVLEDPTIHLVTSACVPCERGSLGLRAMDHGKDYFTDKPPFTSLEELEAARRKVAKTGRIFAVYYAERLHVEAAVYADQLIRDGAIGRVVQVLGLGPHRLNAPSRPDWFWDPAKYGGILVDIGSHQIEQFLHYAGAQNARVLHSKVGNYHAPDHPLFQDFGDASLLADNGATFYFRVDWFTPQGLGCWGDGRTVILGTDGYLELRKYVDVARTAEGDQVYLVDHRGEHHHPVHGKVGFPYFGQLILDCLNRTENAMPQRHTFLAIELALQAQAQALTIPTHPTGEGARALTPTLSRPTGEGARALSPALSRPTGEGARRAGEGSSTPSEVRIARIETFPFVYPTAGRFKFFEGPGGRPLGRATVLVKITADNGVVGWGQSVPSPRWSYETLETVRTTIDNYLTPELLGCAVFDTEAIQAAMDRFIAPSFSMGAPICKAGIDLALFDLTGRLLGQSAAQRWGRGGRNRLTLSWTLNPRTIEEVETRVAEGRARGYRHFNVKVAPDPAFDLELCRTVKRLVPDGFLWADANGGYDEATAIEVVPKLADLGVAVLEQPLPANRLSGYRRLKKQGALPILMDEGVVSAVELAEFIELGMLDGVAMKPARCGGLTEARRQIELLLDRGLMWLGSGLCDPDVSLAASLVLYGAYGLERPAALNGPQFLTDSLLRQPLVAVDGELGVPDGAGLGVEVDEARLLRGVSPGI